MDRLFKVLLIAIAGLLTAVPLHAANVYWTGTTGDYNVPGNWDIGVPIAGDQARVNNGGIVNMNTAPVSAPDFILAGFGASTSGTVNQTGVDLSLAGGLLYLGYDTGSVGTYNISGGSLKMLSGGNAANGYWRMGWNQSGVGTAQGNMTISDGAKVEVTGRAYLGVITGGNANVTVSGGSTLQTGGDFDLGFAGGSGTVTLSDTSILNSAALNLTMIGGAGNNSSGGSVGTLTATGTATWNTGTTYVGYIGATGLVNLGTLASTSGNVVTVSNKSFYIADSQNLGIATKGTVNLYGTSKIIGINGSQIGNWGATDGKLNMTDHTVFSLSSGSLFVGHNQNGVGEINMSGHAYLDLLNGQLHLGNSENYAGAASGTLNMHDNATADIGGYFIMGAFAGSSAAVNMDGDSSISQNNGEVWIGNLDSSGTFTLSGNAKFVNAGLNGTVIGSTAGYGTLNLNGNSVYQTVGISGTVNGTVNLDGGTLKASGTNANWLGISVNYNVMAGGAKIDTGTFNATVLGHLQTDSTSTGGGLTKIGQGTLTLNGDCTYTGTTTIQQGTLVVNNISLASSSIVVKSAGTLAGNSAMIVYPTTTVESEGTIAPGTLGGYFFLDELKLENNSKLQFAFDISGSSDSINVDGNVTAVGGSPITVQVNYSGAIQYETPVLSVSGNLDTNITFALPNPVLDSADAINTSGAWLTTVHGAGGSVTLNPGGVIPDPAWSNSGGGPWSNNGNWGSGPYPNGGDKRAMFIQYLGGPVSVTLDVSPQLSSMIFKSPGGESYTITPSGGNFITMHSTIATDWHVSVLGGEHTVAADIKMAAGTGQSAVRLADESHLTLSGVLSNETTAAGINVAGNFNGGTLATGVLTLSGANTYTGPTIITNAVLEISSIGNVAVANPLGKSSVDPANFVLNNSVLHYSGTAAVSTDRGITINGGVINNDGDLTIGGKVTTTNIVGSYFNKEGAGTLTFNSPSGVSDFGFDIGNEYYPNAGKTVFDGVAGTEYKAWIIHTGTNFKTDMDVINNATLIVGALPMGWGNDNGAGATATMSGNSSATCFYWAYMGVGTNTVADVTMNNNASITTQHDSVWIGTDGGTGTLIMSNKSSITSAGSVYVGVDINYLGATSDGNVTMNDEAKINAAGWLLLGNDGVGSLTLNNKASVVVSGNLLTCGNGGSGSSGDIKLNGTSSLTAGGRVWIGTGVSGTAGTVTLVDTLETVNNPTFTANGTVTLGSGGGTGTLNLNGGTFSANAFLTSLAGSIGTVNFNGGAMKALAASTDFFATDDPAAIVALNVEAGGAKFDTNGFDVIVTKPLVHDAISADGGLMKLGHGTLTLTVDPTYDGDTIVNLGTLTVGNLNTPAAMVYVAMDSTINASSIVANTLVIGGDPLPVASAAAVPEPGSLVLLALACMGVLLAWRRK